jgi:hypothetical protein
MHASPLAICDRNRSAPRQVARVVQQEGVMPVRRVDFGVADVAPVVEQGLDDLAAARRLKSASRW